MFEEIPAEEVQTKRHACAEIRSLSPTRNRQVMCYGPDASLNGKLKDGFVNSGRMADDHLGDKYRRLAGRFYGSVESPQQVEHVAGQRHMVI